MNSREAYLLVICDLSGNINQIIRDDLQMLAQDSPGKSVAILADNNSLQKLLKFVKTLIENDSAFNWEITVRHEDLLSTWFFTGIKIKKKLIIIASSRPQNQQRIFQELEKFPEQISPAAISRMIITAKLDTGCEQNPVAIYEEFTRINNSMAGMQRELTKQNIELERQKIKYKSLIDKMINGFAYYEMIFTEDDQSTDFRFLIVNSAFEKLTGFRTKDIIGKNFTEFFPEIVNSHNEWIAVCKKIALDGGEVFFEEYFENLDKYLKIMIYSPARSFLAMIFDDITLKVKTLNELSNYREQLKLINSILRHDITNYLASTISALNIFKRNNDPDMLNEAHNSIKKSVDLIVNMRELEKFLHLNKKLKVYELRPIIHDLIKTIPEIEFSVIGNARILADEALSSVFENIIRNAIQHGQTKKIEFKIESANSQIQVYITDWGKGIPNLIKDKIFDENFSHGETGQTGLGLFIVKRAMKNYQGEVRVEDNPAGGTIFILTFRKSI